MFYIFCCLFIIILCNNDWSNAYKTFAQCTCILKYHNCQGKINNRKYMRMNGTCYNDHLCQKDASHSLTSKSFISPINGTKEMLPKYRNLKTENNTELWFQA